MEMPDLTTFVVVADELHFGRAAELLHLTQPAVSHRVKRLERDLGTDLFVRSGRTVSLTEAGELVHRRAPQILRDVARLREDVVEMRAGRAGRVRIGFVGTATYDLLPRLSRRVEQALPHVRLELVGEQLTPDLLAALESGTLDLAVVRDAPPMPTCRRTSLRSEAMVVALPSHHPAAEHAQVDLVDLREERFVVHPSSPPSAMHAAVLAACRSAGFTPRDTLEVRETSTLVTSVAAGLGVALVPDPVRALQLDGVTYRPARGCGRLVTELSVVEPAGSSAAAQEVSAILQELAVP